MVSSHNSYLVYFGKKTRGTSFTKIEFGVSLSFLRYYGVNYAGNERRISNFSEGYVKPKLTQNVAFSAPKWPISNKVLNLIME